MGDRSMTDPIQIHNLTFQYSITDNNQVTKELSLVVPRGVRCLLIGSNGAGKTTLLNILGGKHMHSEKAVSVLGQPSFGDTHSGITVLSGQWSKSMCQGGGVPYQNDVTVTEMLETVKDKNNFDP